MEASPLFAAVDFPFQRILALCHRPSMIRREDRFQQEGKIPKYGFFSLHDPQVVDIGEVAIAAERPFAGTFQVAPGFEREPVRVVRRCDGGVGGLFHGGGKFYPESKPCSR